MLKNNRLIVCSSRNSIILLSKITNISYFTVSSLYRLILMASKSMSKKFYKKCCGSTENSSRCRLCRPNGIQDQRHCKNLFNKKNEKVLNNVELIHGEKLPHVNGFPNLICRPCERRLNNTISFKNVISETQKSLLKDSRSKRCPEVSPSVARPSTKVAAVESRRRSLALDFVNVSSSSDETISATPLPMPIEVSQLTTCVIAMPAKHDGRRL